MAEIRTDTYYRMSHVTGPGCVLVSLRFGNKPGKGPWVTIRANGRTWLCISIPKVPAGVKRLVATPGLAVEFNRDVFSSDSRAFYSARSEVSNTRADVTLSRMGNADGVIEGEFSADVSSFPRTHVLHITQGKFRMKVSEGPAQ